ncbi:MAG TPA: glucose 1-dehydrogenase [Bryobacteraceae bacterium]|nr:glucose 1-dehydrogenase [Bryobacteraceae bacterium]
MRLKDKVAIVTGGAAGLGRAVAIAFAREGARLVIADVDEGNGNSALREARAYRDDAAFVRTDIGSEADVGRLVQSTLEAHGRIDVLYNNAAILFHDRDARAHELSLEVWDAVMRVNLRGFFLCSRCVIPAMLAQGGGSIIHVGSPTGFLGCAPTLTAYSSSKGGILGLTRVMAASYARDHIRVNSIIPGTMDTPMNASIMADGATREKLREAVPMGRLGTAEDIAGLAVFLASDESAYCTGGLYTCDGGLTAV